MMIEQYKSTSATKGDTTVKNAKLTTWVLTDGSSIPCVELIEGNQTICQLVCTTETVALELINKINTSVEMIRFD